MAWKLRQFFEGDRTITVADVDDSVGNCWVDGSGNYVPNSIAIKINGVEYIQSTVLNLDVGFLGISVPSGVYIGPTTTIQVYAVCETDPESTTVTLTAKPVGFSIYNGPLKACTPQVALIAYINEYIRFFFTGASGDYFTATTNTGPLTMADFSYQSEDTGNIASTSGGVFSRPAISSTNATLISNSSYSGGLILTITPASTTKYFTARMGYIELIFDNGSLKYSNYMQSGEFEVSSGTYSTSDVFTIENATSGYIVRKNGSVLFSKPKTVTFTVSGGSVTPSTSTIGTPVAWNVPSSAGNYTFTATLGNSVVFQKQIALHSCADAVNDTFTGTYNTPFSGNVSTNDTACVGESTYYELVPASTPIGGTVVVNQNGTFTFTPTSNFNAAASFQYNIKCGSSFGGAEVVDTATTTINYFNSCNGVVANWVDTGETRCNNCTEEKEQRDTNAQCTGNSNRWVANSGGSKCNTEPNLVPTGLTDCVSCLSKEEVQDLNPCSSTFTQKSWRTNPLGNACDTVESWIDNGQFDCVNCVEKKQQYNNKPCSPTFNTTRWVDNPGGTQCNRLAQWTDTNEYTCVNCVEQKQQKDNNSCSPSFNQIRNVSNPTGTACDTDAIWVDTGVTKCENGIHQKQQTSINNCSNEEVRWINTGLEVCGCIGQIGYKNICGDDNPVTGVVVNKAGTVESNRLISFNGSVITYKVDLGQANYIAYVTHQSGIVNQIRVLSNNCNPVI